MNKLVEDAKLAKSMCKGSVRKKFQNIYPFTTENISGYIKHFDLASKRLLTIGSSGDQMLNALLYGCYDQTSYDICPFTKYYFYLKYAAIMRLDYEEYLKYFCFRDYISPFKNNKDTFNKETTERLLYILKNIDFDSYIFWTFIFKSFDGLTIRSELFSGDEDGKRLITKYNPYLNDISSYNELKRNIKYLNAKFYRGDIQYFKLDEKYDIIFLSNLADFFDVIPKYKDLLDNLFIRLNTGGSCLISYLFDTVDGNKYDKKFASIYNLEETKKILGEYITEFITFTGVKGILFEDEDFKKDSALIYKKKN